MTTETNTASTGRTFVGKVMSLLFNTLSRFVTAFLPRSERLLIPWLRSPSAVVSGPTNIKPLPASTVPPTDCHEATGLDAAVLVFLMFSFKSAFSPASFTLTGRLSSSSYPGIHLMRCSEGTRLTRGRHQPSPRLCQEDTATVRSRHILQNN